MLRALTPLHVLLGVLVFVHADLECETGSCEPTDHISLIQGLLEPDLVVKLQAQSEEMPEKVSKLFDRIIVTTTQSTTRRPVVQGTKVKLNEAGDLPAFLAAIRFDVGLFVFFFVCFLMLRRWYPLTYSWRWNEQLEGGPGGTDAQILERLGWFNFVGKAFRTPILLIDEKPANVNGEEGASEQWPSIERRSGLDAAMLMKFVELALELMVVIGLPACLLGIPVYAFAGGGIAGADRLSWAGIGNVVFNNTKLTGEPMEQKFAEKLDSVQWIYWTVGVAVWPVVIYTQWRMKCYQEKFLVSRKAWLLRMPEPRSTTVLVQGVPCDYRSDVELKKFFNNAFGDDCVESAFVVLTTSNLSRLISHHKDLRARVADLERQSQTDEASRTDLANKTEEMINTLDEIVRVQNEIKSSPNTHATTNGFVTFRDRKSAELALGIKLSEDDDEWVLETPPAPTDVRYGDFEYPDAEVAAGTLLGYAAVAGLFFAFMPIVVGLSNIALTIEHTPFIVRILDMTGFKSTVNGTLQTIGLTIMMSMLPTFLAWIFRLFFTLKADRWEQLKIQVYYFWFLMVFVLLTTSVASNLADTIAKLTKSPFSIFSLLADKMPVTTHFYLNYVVMQPVTHGMNLTRYMNLLKFWIFRRVCDSIERARELSEPEDQDYYGIGSRSARFTLMLIIGLVFGTICPLMHVVVFYNFIVCRLVYGYLIPYQEKRKDDMGGVSWCCQMQHLHCGLVIYLVMMTGVLLHRAESHGPGIISAVSFLWWYIAWRRFTTKMHWETLPYVDVVEKYTPGLDKVAMEEQYEQPQLKYPKGALAN